MAKKKTETKIEEKKDTKNNVMRVVKMEKVVLNIGGTGESLVKGVKLLKIILPERKATKTKATKRIPTLSVRPGLEVGVVVTVRKGKEELLRRMLSAVDNTIKKKQLSENNFSFGIKEYIEIPGIEYQRDIGIIGLDVTVVFKRAGRRVRLKKVKRGKIPEKQKIQPEEIVKFMEENFRTKFK
jgi:large subunit ribosomal protein L5